MFRAPLNFVRPPKLHCVKVRDPELVELVLKNRIGKLCGVRLVHSSIDTGWGAEGSSNVRTFTTRTQGMDSFEFIAAGFTGPFFNDRHG